jgi:hypothetical protein
MLSILHMVGVEAPAASVYGVSFDLNEADGESKILFAQRGWREEVEFMHYCSTKWAVYLVGLKALLETGCGTPYPNDTRITRRF